METIAPLDVDDQLCGGDPLNRGRRQVGDPAIALDDAEERRLEIGIRKAIGAVDVCWCVRADRGSGAADRPWSFNDHGASTTDCSVTNE